MRYADLHVHTFYSDSTFSPEEVVSCAKEKELSAIAICDHDSVSGIERSLNKALELGVEVIPAVEMTGEKIDVEIHILGYFIDWKIKWFQEELKNLQDARVERLYKMVEKLSNKNIKIDTDDVLKLAGPGSVGRLHLSQVMLKEGKVRNIREAFDKYIGFAKPCYVPNVRLTPKEAIGMILKAGGVPVLAHPNVMGKDEYIGEYIEYGLRGIEVYHTEHNGGVEKHYKEIAEKYNLIITGGSDCHGMGKGRVLMGSVKVPYEIVERLKEEAGKIAHEYR